MKPQVVAPGVSILSAFNNGDDAYRQMSGTSMSAPHVSGLVALMWDAAPCLIGEYAATETILETTADPVPYDDGTGNGTVSPNYATGWGEINALNAVQVAKDYCGADFRVDAAPEQQSVCAPADALFDVNIEQVMGFEVPVTLNLLDAPPNAGIHYDPNPVTPPDSSILTLNTSSVTQPGSYEMEVTGVYDELLRTDKVNLDLYTGVPSPPSLGDPIDEAGTISVMPTFRWQPVEQASYYRLEIAADEAFDDIVYTVDVTKASHTMPQWLEYGQEYYWRVRAGNACGLSDASTSSFETGVPASILVVDDDDNKPDVQSYYTETLDALGYRYDVWDTWNSDDEPDSTNLSPYEVVIWFLGDEWESPAGPGEEAEAALTSWLDAGHCLMINGQDYLWNRDVNDFVQTYMGVADFESDVAQTSITGGGAGFDGLGPYDLDYLYFNFSDALTPTDSAEIALSGNRGNAGLMVDNGDYKTTLWSFPFESVATDLERQELLDAVLTWCGLETYQLYLPLIEN
jgi:hypothetical protein